MLGPFGFSKGNYGPGTNMGINVHGHFECCPVLGTLHTYLGPSTGKLGFRQGLPWPN